MRKLFTGLLFMSLLQSAQSQDLAMAPPLGTFLAPVSGCSLTANETVTIRIFNAGAMLPAGTSFNVSYSVNAGAPVTELITLGANFASATTLTYSFTSTADLSAPGVYSIDATVSLAGDVTASNDTYTGYSVTNNAASVGGTVSGGTAVCITANSGNLTLAGNTGNVLNWEYSTDGGATWVNISNTTTTQSYTDLTVETWYRANVQNASCAAATSSIGIITVDPASVGGSTTGGTTPACSGANSGTITLSGHTGNVIRWESSTDGGVTWSPIANVTTTQSYLNLVTSTRYRAVVQSGACVSANSTQRNITINPPSVGGTVNSSTSVCSGSNSGTLTLSGQTGTVQRWEFSTDGGTSWTPITNTTTSQSYLNLTQTTMYRAQVKSGACSSTFSAAATITVVSASVGGTIDSDANQCYGTGSDTLTLIGYSGSVLNWEISTDGGTTWNNYASTADTLIYSNLITTTLYRANVQAGGCTASFSAAATITVDTLTVGGTISSDATVCAAANSGTVTLSGNNGTVNQWEYSQDGGTTWTTIANTTLSESYTNLSGTTFYRAQVQNGVCPSGYSDTVTITVDSVTVGGSISSSATVCSGINTGTLNVTGGRGNVLSWEFSTDGGLTWINIANTTTSQSYNNITVNTQYRAQLQNGVCPSATSSNAILTVDAQAVGGTVYGGTTVCASSNSGTLTLIGHVATVLSWESSTDGGATWTPIANLTPFQPFTNLTASTDFRAITASGVCPNDTSSIGTVIVDSATVGGAVSLDDTVCSGANAGTLTLAGNTGDVVSWEMSNDGGTTWITLANDTTFQNYLNLNATTTYRAKVKSGVCPQVGSTPATITVNAQSDGGEVNSSATVCGGQNFGVLTLFGAVGNVMDWEMSQDAGTTWTGLGNTGTTQSYTNLTDTTWYRVIVQSGICAADTSTYAFINLYPAPVVDFNSDTVCLGTPLTFVNTTVNSVGFVTLYNWNLGDGNTSTSTNPTHTYTTAGTMNVTLFAMNNFGCTDTTTKNILVNALPFAIIAPSGPTSFCEGDTVQLTAAFNGLYSYAWSNGASGFQITVDTTGDYTVTVTDTPTGCINTATETVTVFSLTVADAGADTSVSNGFSIVLVGNGGSTYEWTPSTSLDNPFAANPVASPTATTTYVLTVTDINGCQDTDSVNVMVNNDFLVTVRNIITPNGDGFNDTWIIENILTYPANVVTVYNRNGQMVYESESYNNMWDGTYNGDPLPDGTYYYVIEFTDSEDVVKGAVNIIRSTNE
jgi:gliding motility-associated-like protein